MTIADKDILSNAPMPTILEETQASKVISVATALGASIPAPVGTFLHIALFYGDDNRSYLLGAYQSEGDARKRIILDIVQLSREKNYYPWDSEGNFLDPNKLLQARRAVYFDETRRPKAIENSFYSLEFEEMYLRSHNFDQIRTWGNLIFGRDYGINRLEVLLPIENLHDNITNSVVEL